MFKEMAFATIAHFINLKLFVPVSMTNNFWQYFCSCMWEFIFYYMGIIFILVFNQLDAQNMFHILCIMLVKYWDKYTETHGQQNVKKWVLSFPS